jgi:hypothetical protein
MLFLRQTEVQRCRQAAPCPRSSSVLLSSKRDLLFKAWAALARDTACDQLCKLEDQLECELVIAHVTCEIARACARGCTCGSGTTNVICSVELP